MVDNGWQWVAHWQCYQGAMHDGTWLVAAPMLSLHGYLHSKTVVQPLFGNWAVKCATVWDFCISVLGVYYHCEENVLLISVSFVHFLFNAEKIVKWILFLLILWSDLLLVD